MKKEQEYLYGGQYVTIVDKYDHGDDMVIVDSQDGLLVARRANLERKEDSYQYKRAQERKAELENITKEAEKNLDKLADKLVDKALIALSSRMKFNVVFGDSIGQAGSWAVMIADELKKMVKDKSKDTLKDKLDF